MATVRDCHFFMHGSCAKGATCPFKHDEEKKAKLSERFSGACIYFQQGYCARGAHCMYRHDTSSKAEDAVASLDVNEEEEEEGLSSAPDSGSKEKKGAGKGVGAETTELERMRALVKERMSQPLNAGPNSAPPARPTYQRAFKPPPTPQFSTPLAIAPSAAPPRKKAGQAAAPKLAAKSEELEAKDVSTAEEQPKQRLFGRAAVERAKKLGLLPEKRKVDKEGEDPSAASNAGGTQAPKKRVREPIVFGVTKMGNEQTTTSVAPSVKPESSTPIAAKPEVSKKRVPAPIPSPASSQSKKPVPIVFNPSAAKAAVGPSKVSQNRPAAVKSARTSSVEKPNAPMKAVPPPDKGPVKSTPINVETKATRSTTISTSGEAQALKAATPQQNNPPSVATAEAKAPTEHADDDGLGGLEEPADDDDYDLEDEELNELYNAFD